MKKLGLLGAILPLLLITGCTTTNKDQTVVRYMCSDNLSYAATYYQDENKSDLMDLTLPDGQKVTLANVVAASGAKYTGSIYEWWTKGDTATFTRSGNKPLQCRQVNGAQ